MNIFISMTNEELIEELYYKAHIKGFFNELHDRVKELKNINEIKCKHEMVRVAYDELKNSKLACPTHHS